MRVIFILVSKYQIRIASNRLNRSQLREREIVLPLNIIIVIVYNYIYILKYNFC